jgi:hypothetical protein
MFYKVDRISQNSKINPESLAKIPEKHIQRPWTLHQKRGYLWNIGPKNLTAS